MSEEYPKLVHKKTHVGYPLSGRVITIGSAKECHISLSDKGMPELSAHLLFVNGAYHIHSLTLDVDIEINGEPIRKQRALRHGNVIKIGTSELTFVDIASGQSADALTKIHKGSKEFIDRLIAITISLLRNKEDDVFDDLVSSVSQLLRCDASRLVVENTDTGERETLSRYPKGAGLDRYSNRAIDWARKESGTILLYDSDWEVSDQSLQSLEKNLVSSVLCAPLKSEDETLGYLYLDRLQKDNPFTEEDKRLCDSLVPLFSEILVNRHELKRQKETIERLQKEQLTTTGSMIFQSETMHKTVGLAMKLAKTDSPVLILGETGTGKELIAHLIHNQSQRADQPFKAINCGAIPDSLIESELFGHEKGAFTGATSRKIGLFEAADGGTLFLDEIGELPIQLQVRLLRVLQESEIIRVGGNENITINVRILAATNRNLENEIEVGTFRQDLYFRLNVLAIEMPPLRERDQDTILLAGYFAKKYAQQFGLQEKVLSAQTKKFLLKHSWPGNIRELENIIQKAILISTGNRILPDDIEIKSLAFPQNGNGESAPVTLREARNVAEREMIMQTLKKAKGNISLSAKMLEIDRKWLMKKMQEFGVDANDYRHS